jgi:nuclear pore complex protein Nup188
LALNLLRAPEEEKRLESLDGFLSKNKELLSKTDIFDAKKGDLPQGDEFSIRGSTYKVSSANKRDAEELAELLSFDKKEVLRVICESTRRIPEPDIEKKEKDEIKAARDETQQLYLNRVLKERRTVLQLVRHLLTHESHHELGDKYSSGLLESSQYITNAISTLESLMNRFENEPCLKYKDVIGTENAYTMVEILKVLTTLLLRVSTTGNNVALWFQLWERHRYFTLYEEYVSAELYQEIQSLISISTLLFFGLNTKDDCIDSESSYLTEPAVTRTIHDAIASAPYNAVVVYMWGLLLYMLPPEIQAKVFTDDEDCEVLSRVFAAKAAELDVFQTIEEINNALMYDGLYIAILASFLICTVSFVQLNDKTTKTYSRVFKDAPNAFIEKFFANETTEKQLYISRAKFPEVMVPYLRLLSINGAFAHSQLSNLSTYLHIASAGIEYDSDIETDTITLKNELYIKPPFEETPDVFLEIAAGTQGKVLPTADQNKEALILNYNHNGWALLGRVIRNIATDPDKEQLLLTILELLTNTLNVSNVDTTSEILESLSEFLDDSDILDIILKLFEQSLHQRNVSVSTQLLELLNALIDTYPQIVWSHLVRSDLLEHGGRGGLIGTILGSVETISGSYEFTIASLKLFNTLVSKSTLDSENLNSHRANVIPKFTTHASQVFESFIYWNYKHPHQKFEIGSLILEVFCKILILVYGIEPDADPNTKVTRVLSTAAKRIITSFAVSLPDVRIITPILAAMDALNSDPPFYSTSGNLGFWFTQWAKMSLDFSKIVVSIRSTTRDIPSTLEKSLFSRSPQLVTIYSTHYSLRSSVLQLLTELVNAKWPADVPSLVSHLGDQYTGVLLAAVSSDLQFLYDDFVVKQYLYMLFSSVIEGRQKGLSMIFLNGKDIKEGKAKQKSLLKILKEDVKNLDYYPEWLSIHLVDAVAYAYNIWSSKKNEDEDEAQFIKTLVPKLTSVELDLMTITDNTKIIEGCYKYTLNSRVAEICALVIFSSSTETTTKPIFDLLTSTDILKLIKPLYERFDYDVIIHKNLLPNFQAKWPELKLHQFIRSPLSVKTRYGEGSVYDLTLLDSLLGSNHQWTGSGVSQGFRAEVVSASLNVQYVSAQISAAKSWGALLTSYVKKVKISVSFLKVIKKLLEANLNEDSSILLFSKIHRVRVELAFFFLYSLSQQSTLSAADTQEILEIALQLVISHDVDFLLNLSSQNYEVYRPLLRIISKLLTNAKGATKVIEALSGELLEFSEIVIAKGTTVIFEAVQTDYRSSEIGGRIEDLLLIISLFKGLIAAKPPKSFTTRLSTLLVDYSTLKSILNVYSNSHSLKIHNDAVFAELSLTYIVELIFVDVIAEQLISSGLFSTLIQSPISLTIEEGGIFVHNAPKLHNIWTNGLLPIILILMNKFGVRLLPEISAFVSYFSNQFTSTIQSWSQDSVAITIPALQETEQIIILQKGLDSLYREFGQISPRALSETADIIPGLDSPEGRAALNKSLIHLLAHPKYLTSRVIPTTLEEQRLFEGEDKVRTPLVEKLVSQITDVQQTLTE